VKENAFQFKRVIVYARHHRANVEVIESLNRMLAFLSTLPLKTYLDTETAISFDLPHPVLPRQEMGKAGDIIVVIGGDGSLLSAARMAVTVGVPVIGVNRGRLGFLTDISPQQLEDELRLVLQGSYQEESRFLLQAHIVSSEGFLFKTCALNDIVVSRGLETHLMEFEVLVDNALVSHYRADGIIFATPTGSTAYSLSAGGPILHPGLNAIVIVPMFPHRLSSRPIVLDAGVKIILKPGALNELDLQLSADSHEQEMVRHGQWICIEKHPVPLRLLHPKTYDYFDTLRIKLGWEGDAQVHQ
jgi:NAD+ kinase